MSCKIVLLICIIVLLFILDVFKASTPYVIKYIQCYKNKKNKVANSYEFIRLVKIVCILRRTTPNPFPEVWPSKKSFKILRVRTYEFIQISHLIKYIWNASEIV